MARPRAACGTYGAYRRHLREHEPIDAKCRKAQREHDGARSTSADARMRRQAEKSKAKAAPADVPTSGIGDAEALPVDGDAKLSRIEVLEGLLTESRAVVRVLMATDPGRVYLQMREQREIVRELSELQGNGQVKGVTLADQLAEARARRKAAAKTAAASG